MMKKLMIMPLLILMLVACQSNTLEEAAEKETNETEENEHTNEKNSEEEEAVDLSLYEEVVKEYEKLTEMPLEEAHDENFEYVKSGAVYNIYDDSLYEGVSASYYDLNDDGVDELIIALSFQSGVGSYSLIDLYTIVDGELVSIFTDDMSMAATYKRSGYSLLKNGDLIYTTASGQGERFGEFYELDEETMEYVQTYVVSDEEGDFEQIEEELENNLDFTTLEWETIGKEKVRTAYDNFLIGDYSALEGIWENSHEGSQVTIKGNKLTYMNGDKSSLDFSNEYSDETSYIFNVSVNYEKQLPPLLTFYPENMEIKLGEPVLPSDTKQSRFTITEAGAPGEEDVYYKVSDLED